MTWYDYIAIYWHANIMTGGVLAWLHGDLGGAVWGATGWITWRIYENWRAGNYSQN